ncbi:hypothetical protein B9479_002235 [Cryptococcus floricola]|uniref:Uncharacterized protein n=1 Tax=Cryptococcus floricola TaxID=2591691 RepID=A0A5D3B2Z7_9TREE|nr:hypothetical protein B9479_002235 [Cryptococcus floricola]
MSEAYQEPSTSNGPSGTQAGTSADERRAGSTTDTGPVPSTIWTRYGYEIKDTIFCPGDPATYSKEDVHKQLAEDSGLPLESIKVTLLSTYKANDETSQWEASYFNGAESQGRKCLSLEPSTANKSVPIELIEAFAEDKKQMEEDKQREGDLNDILQFAERLNGMIYASRMEGDQTSDNGHNNDL